MDCVGDGEGEEVCEGEVVSGEMVKVVEVGLSNKRWGELGTLNKNNNSSNVQAFQKDKAEKWFMCGISTGCFLESHSENSENS